VILKQDYYNRNQLDLERIWAHDRVDNVVVATASLNWDILRKRDTPYLTLFASYQFQMDDSNMNGPDDFLAQRSVLLGTATSYSTQVNSVKVQLNFSPSVLIRPK